MVEAGFLLISFLAVSVGPFADVEAEEAELKLPLWLGVLRGRPLPFLGPVELLLTPAPTPALTPPLPLTVPGATGLISR